MTEDTYINTVPSHVSNVFLLDASKRCSFFSDSPRCKYMMTRECHLNARKKDKKKMNSLEFLKNSMCMQGKYTKSQFTFHKRDKCIKKARRDRCAVYFSDSSICNVVCGVL